MPLDSETQAEFDALKTQHGILEEKIGRINDRHVAASDAFFQLRRQLQEEAQRTASQQAEIAKSVQALLDSVTLLRQETQALSNKIDANELNRVNRK